MRFLRPSDLADGYVLTHEKIMVNVGSVGQPRDNDPRSCYVITDGESIRYRRVEYDVEATVRKIEAIADLDNFLGYRLRDGH
jgi:diadenosine tetraphosphatase ApaH/serine/threonine PP2A family protein phosphatase